MIEEIVIGNERNDWRPLDASELLREAADKIDELYNERKATPFVTQPFLVLHVVVDVRHGLVSIFTKENE